MTAGGRIQAVIRERNARGEPAIAPFITAGFPSRERFVDILRDVEREADVIEIGVPFSDPMADGVTIQRSSRAALEQGVHLDWILSTLAEEESATPRILMSYYNPLLAFGLERLASRVGASGVDALIVPDLPFEEQGDVRSALFEAKVGLIQLVTPVTPRPRQRSLAEATAGFLYAVTVTGTTGGRPGDGTSDGTGNGTGQEELLRYLAELSADSPAPVLAGFGVRSHDQLTAIARVAAGAVVGSALIEALEAGTTPAAFLRTLRYGTTGVDDRRPAEVSR